MRLLLTIMVMFLYLKSTKVFAKRLRTKLCDRIKVMKGKPFYLKHTPRNDLFKTTAVNPRLYTQTKCIMTYFCRKNKGCSMMMQKPLD